MEFIVNWIKGIAFFLILILAVQNVLPDNKYKKYIKVFSGMILILLLISPLTDAFHLTDKIAGIYEGKLIEQDVKDMKMQLSGMESSVYEAAINQYKEVIKGQTQEIVEGEGMVLKEFACTVDDGGEELVISSITLAVGRNGESNSKVYIEEVRISAGGKSDEPDQEEELSVNNIKKSIADFYNISTDNINISIR